MRLLVLLGVLSLLVVSILLGQCRSAGHAGDTKHMVVKPDEIKWGASPPSLPPGVQMGVLVGDPSQADKPYVVRAKLPDGYKIPPHWHPHDENLTVLQGTLLVGQGEKFERSKTEELPAGSFMRMPKGTRHFAVAKGVTILQLHGTGPFEVRYVNPADDPRKSKGKE